MPEKKFHFTNYYENMVSYSFQKCNLFFKKSGVKMD